MAQQHVHTQLAIPAQTRGKEQSQNGRRQPPHAPQHRKESQLDQRRRGRPRFEGRHEGVMIVTIK